MAHLLFDLSGGQGLLGQVEGRTAGDAAYWLAQATPAWRDAVRVVAIDMCSIYASAVRRMLPGAQIAVDLFHVVHLAVKMTGDVRRRVVRGKYGRRGRSGDPEYGIKNLLVRNLEHLSQEGRYRPLPARRVLIPKPGTTEQRPLSIPPVRDRIVQAAVKIMLEPVFEADFLPCSFGFRPGRSPHDALQVLIDECWRGRRWVVETDIANCFSAIPHDKLMQAVEERVCDQPVLKLLRAMLRAGVMQDGQVRRPDTGAAQGGVISPVMCNVYLHRLDRGWNDGDGVLVRFADDLVVMCWSRSQAEAALARLAALLADLGLEPKAAKTRVVHLEEGGEGLIFSASITGWCARGGWAGNRG